MDLDYLPGGRWVRVLGVDGWTVAPIGRWHLAVDDAPNIHAALPVALICGRELRIAGVVGGEIVSIAGLPQGNACPVCERSWERVKPPAARHGRAPHLSALA